MVCRFVAKFQGRLYSWIDEVVNTLSFDLTFKFDQEVKIVAILPYLFFFEQYFIYNKTSKKKLLDGLQEKETTLQIV